MCLFRKKEIKEDISSKFNLKDYVDFFYKDDVYFGVVSNIYLDGDKQVIYDIDVAGQCPTTFKGINEEKLIRIHKE